METGQSAVLFCLILLFAADQVNVKGEMTVDSDATSMQYLLAYGWVTPQDPRTGALRSEESVKNAIMEYQQFAGVPMTGIIDDDTKRMMNMPRCGNSDRIGTGSVGGRRKRYTLQGSKFPNNEVTYTISQYTPDMVAADVDREIARAFQVWSNVTPLRFIRRDTGKVDIEIKFVAGSHGDGNPFDGRGRTLAHAYFPQFGGDAHFDEDEPWTLNTRSGVNLFQVAAHEFGHSLGLSHSDVQSALMAPFYRGYVPDFKLDTDDIMGIQELYGRAPVVVNPQPNPATTTTMPPPPSGAPDICNMRNFALDAVTTMSDGSTYFFRGDYYWRRSNRMIDQGFPRRISDDFPGLPGNLDAALTWPNGYTYFFKGSQYYKFRLQTPVAGFPRPISRGFSGAPNDLDAAFVWSGNGKTYFIKGDKYYRYTSYRVDYGYPRPLSVWRGLPSNLQSAFKFGNGRTYFFKDDKYYRFNDRDFQIDNGYPRSTRQVWFGCASPVKEVPAVDSNTGGFKNTNPLDGNQNQWVLAGVNMTTTVETTQTSGSGVVAGSLLSLVVAFCLSLWL
ncbi:matrix metalloproteinase-16-like [Lingula anatina]|uniref:Matrix metalloproteinase-16-like n=1 Tax=Lingula anatina TaxID=7574 RepID=A0A1S3HNP5_LINAN|nr:matrix metalloproteinase-16-like [Lingula anatina]|eukprot:XP_013387678.1 matrix metalloproteinase-16-like [Lingula anatina]